MTPAARRRQPPIPARFGRSGSAPVSTLAVLSLVVLATMFGALRGLSGDSDSIALELYCAAALRPPIERAVVSFEKQTGTRVQIQYGGSGSLLATIKLSGRGDLFIAADDSYVRMAQEQGLVAESIPLATMRPVIAVREGNPRNVRTLSDLLRGDVSFAMANPSVAAVGSVTRDELERRGLWSKLEAQCRVFKPTVTDVAADVKIGTVDAGIIWDVTAAQMEGVEVVPVNEFESLVRTVEVGVLVSSDRRDSALRLARYLSASDGGGFWLDRLGYGSIDRTRWKADGSTEGGNP